MTFRIGLDLDGVAYDWDKTARYMMRQHYINTGRPVPVELNIPAQSWDWINYAVEPDDWKWLWTEGIAEGLFRYGHIVKGAIEGVQELNELGEVTVITSRPKAAVHDTLVWLSTMFDKAPISGLVIQTERDQKKSDVVPVPDVYIDDALHNARDILELTKSEVVLFNQPWNTNSILEHSRLTRANRWAEVIAEVRSIRENKNG